MLDDGNECDVDVNESIHQKNRIVDRIATEKESPSKY